ncbi:MAG TPA: SAM-dependent methyltransferase [Bacillota bacterium]|nr:SAM-dependent methyltransferase [Bacillota bacterium]
MQFIFTCRGAHRDLTLYEFKRYDASFNFIKWLDEEVGLAETGLSRTDLPWLIRSAPIIFVRHIFFVDLMCAPSELLDAAASLCAAAEQPVSVQVRACPEPCEEPEGLSTRIAERLLSNGIECDLKYGYAILSIYVSNNIIYLGLGDFTENLSRYRGGMPFYSKSPELGFISRAEFKLLEAFECFAIPADGINLALDLGAAPGGWTKALLERGARVIAVDPLKLHPMLQKHNRVRHYAMTAERYLALGTDERFDMIVCDMKANPEKSIAAVKRCYEKLTPGGYAIVTLKLERGFSYKHVLGYLGSVQPYRIVGSRQLFHNRSEITVALKKPEENVN